MRRACAASEELGRAEWDPAGEPRPGLRRPAHPRQRGLHPLAWQPVRRRARALVSIGLGPVVITLFPMAVTEQARERRSTEGAARVFPSVIDTRRGLFPDTCVPPLDVTMTGKLI